MFARNKIVWSPVEIEYLKEHREVKSLSQFSIDLSKSMNAIKNKLAELDGKPIKKKGKDGQFKRGFRKDLKVSVRSGWEANILRWLTFQGKTWMYEPKVFVFEGIKKGTMSYLPDVYIQEDDLWVEIKGFLKNSDKTRIKRFKKFYPEEFKKLRAIVKSENVISAKFYKEIGVPIMIYYRDLDKQCKNTIPNWE